MRKTKQKELVFNIVKNSYNHDSANEIYEKALKTMPNISLATVYRVLNELVQKNLLKRIKINNNIEHYDYIRHKHYHFVCNSCQMIKDVNDCSFNNIKTDFQIDDVIFYGMCNDCIKEGK